MCVCVKLKHALSQTLEAAEIMRKCQTSRTFHIESEGSGWINIDQRDS